MKIGFEGKLYICAAGIGETPTWTEVTAVKDVTLNIEDSEADATTRASAGNKAYARGLSDKSIEFEMPVDPDDDGYLAIEGAFIDGSIIGLAAMFDDIATPGSRGLWMDAIITKFERKEPLDEAVTVSVTAKPGYSANPPVMKIIQ